MNSAVAGAGAGASVGGPWGAVIGGAAGYLMGSDDKSSSINEDMMKKASELPLPVLKEYYPELYKSVVQMNPELESTVNLGPSAMDGVSTDPSMRQAQLNALNKLQEVGTAGGRDGQFLSDANRLQSDVNTNLQGQEGAIQQNMAARGMSGGGSEMVARNMAAQNAANRQSQSGFDLNAQAQQRALQALSQSGQLGGQMQAQDFSQQSGKAQASDAINKFNAQNQQQVISSNTTAKNAAQQLNASNIQNANNQNVALGNDAQKYNLNLPQQNYDNSLKKLGMFDTAATSAAANSTAQAKSQDQFLGGIAGAAGQYSANQKKKDGTAV